VFWILFRQPQQVCLRFAAEAARGYGWPRAATTTFYGICFDYAQAAYNHILGNRAAYEAKGMKRNGWYIVGTGNNYRQITLYDPSSREQATLRMNGVYTKENSR
jgi:hypothetical protein